MYAMKPLIRMLVGSGAVAWTFVMGGGIWGGATARGESPSAPAKAGENDPAMLRLDPVATVGSVGEEEIFLATVLSRDGRPLPGHEVEFILARGPKEVGELVDYDRKGAAPGNPPRPGEQIGGSQRVMCRTNKEASVIDMGTTNLDDNINLTAGQTWMRVLSPLEGETHVIALCPAIRDREKRKAQSVIYWQGMRLVCHGTDNPVEVGKETAYTIEVKNEGRNPCTSLVLTWEIPTEMKFVKAEGPIPFKHETGMITFDVMPKMSPGEKQVFKITCKAIAEGTPRHRAMLRYDPFEFPVMTTIKTLINK
jgi:uncharacterized repeat protein (TIGR01451 family)